MNSVNTVSSLAWREAIDRLPEIATWRDWGKIFLDVSTWAPLVDEICRRAHLPCHSIAAGYPGSNAVFIVNADRPSERAVVKIYAPFSHEDYDFEREIHGVLEEMPELGAPRLLDYGVLVSATRWPYVVLSFISGDPIREVRAQIGAENLRAIATDLGRRVRCLHAVPVDRVSSLDATEEGWQAYIRERIPRTVSDLHQETAFSDRLINQVPAFVSQALTETVASRERCLGAAARPNTGQPVADLVLVSGDITEDHILLVAEQGRWRISGLIDFADARIAPRDYEWIALWFGALNCDVSAFEAFMHSYDPALCLDGVFYRRAMALTLLHEFGASTITYALRNRPPRVFDDIHGLQMALWQPT